MASLGTDVALVSETWFMKHHSTALTDIPGYTAYSGDRVNERKAGGVAVYIRLDYPSVRCFELHHDTFEVLWVRTLLNCKPFYLADSSGLVSHPSHLLHRRGIYQLYRKLFK